VPLGPNVVTVGATRNDNVTPTLQWQLLNPVSGQACADAISGSGVLSPACVGGGRLLMIRATDISVNPHIVANLTVSVANTPFTAPPVPASTTNGFLFGFHTVHVFLSPPSWTGGYPMSGYYVTFACPVLTQVTWGPQTVWVPYAGALTVLTVQKTGISACPVSVQAKNTYGAYSPPVATVLFL
jgi:hypothetical protein